MQPQPRGQTAQPRTGTTPPGAPSKGNIHLPEGSGGGSGVAGGLSTAAIATRAALQHPHGAKRSPTWGYWGVPCSLWASHAQPHGKERGPGATEQRGCPQALSPAAAHRQVCKKQDICERAWAELSRKIPFNTEAEQHD